MRTSDFTTEPITVRLNRTAGKNSKRSNTESLTVWTLWVHDMHLFELAPSAEASIVALFFGWITELLLDRFFRNFFRNVSSYICCSEPCFLYRTGILWGHRQSGGKIAHVCQIHHSRCRDNEKASNQSLESLTMRVFRSCNFTCMFCSKSWIVFLHVFS
jgi:hypothetical protein